jgi:hypothetical protein
MGDRNPNLNSAASFQIPELKLDPAGWARPGRKPLAERIHLMPDRLRLSIDPVLDIIICDQKQDKPGYDLLSPQLKDTFLEMIAENADGPQPNWLKEATADDGDSKSGAAKKDDDGPPYFYAQFQFQSGGSAAQAVLHTTGHGTSAHRTWDAAAGSATGQLVLAFHHENESGWELSVAGQASMNLSTNASITGIQGSSAVTHVSQLTDKLQVQAALQAVIANDMNGNTNGSLMLGATAQYDVTDRVHLQAGINTGVAGIGGPGMGLDTTFTIGFMIDTDTIKLHR